MITYVNTVLVGKGVGSIASDIKGATAGQFIIMNLDPAIEKDYLSVDDTAEANEIKIGLVTANTTSYVDPSGEMTTIPVVKWSNNIKKSDVKSLNRSAYAADKLETVTIDFKNADLAHVSAGGYPITLRITYKDLPTRYRKWTDSYVYVTAWNDTEVEIAEGLKKAIAKSSKRSRINATASEGVLTLTAKAYDDDNSVDSINQAGQVRFNANVYYNDPYEGGLSSKNKYSIRGLIIEKTPGEMYQASAKLVRDREAQAMGYEGILNRGEGTWPIVKPAMNTDLSKHYDAITLEFENVYRAADDIFRKTKQTVEIYEEAGSATNISNALINFVNGTENSGDNIPS